MRYFFCFAEQACMQLPSQWVLKFELAHRFMQYAPQSTAKADVQSEIRKTAPAIDANKRRMVSPIWCRPNDFTINCSYIQAAKGRCHAPLALVCQCPLYPRKRTCAAQLANVR